jgi:Ni/Fe-hydrogenase subunit HybB-like protein
MIEKALFKGSKLFYAWITLLLAVIGVGFITYLFQAGIGLSITGLCRDVSWGLYIGQFTFFVGVAASAVMVVLPYYLHDVKEFGRITILGEFLAIGAVIMCLLFIVVDMGMPQRLLNMIIHATPTSPMFWDMVVLNGYLLLNLLIGWNALEAERKGINPPNWTRPLIYISIPWAVSIHTVTAFLYSGLPGREFWLTALIAPKFLAGAFATGPALLIILCLVLRKVTKFDAGDKAIQKLSLIVTYSLCITVFMIGVEFFTAFYSQVPGHMHSLQFLFAGLQGNFTFVPIMWLFVLLTVLSLGLLLNKKTREKELTLFVACVSVFVAMLIEKGISFVVAGFVTNPFGRVTQYIPTIPEMLITASIWAIGMLIISVLYKIFVAVRLESEI